MSNEIKAYDMGRFQRIVGVEAPRITGMFRVLSMKDEREETLVWPLDMTIWFDNKHWGRTYDADDFTAKVKAGVVNLDANDVRDSKRAEVEEVIEELRAVILAVSKAAAYQDADPTEQEPTP